MKSSKTIVESYLKKQDWRVNENSNTPFSFGAMNKYINAEVSKDYWLHEVYPEYISKAYVDGHIHIHDLGGLTMYCVGYSLKDILLKGVRGVPNVPTSAPAKHFDSVLNQIANLITIFQNEIMGAVALNGFDTLLAPFIKNDKIGYEEVKQSMQNFIFSINSNSRAGSEPAFSNVTFDLTPPKDMLDEYVVIGGKLQSFTYGSCQQEMDLLNRVFFEIMLNGDADGKLFAYPIPTYNIHERFDWDNPNNEMLWEMAGKYGTPYFANFINSELDITDVRSMCPVWGKQKVLVKNDLSKDYHISEVKNLYQNKKDNYEYSIIMDGREKRATLHEFSGLTFYKVKTVNGHEAVLSGNHLNLVYGGDIKRTTDLSEEDYLPFSTVPYDGTGLDYDSGYMVGAFMGDGSLRDKNTVVYSLNDDSKSDTMDDIIKIAVIKFGAKVSKCSVGKRKTCVNIRVISKMLRGLIEDYVSGHALDKRIHAKAIGKSLEFRRGIVDGLIATDGNKASRRIYTASPSGVESICAILASMGIPSNVRVDERPKDCGRLSSNPVWSIRPYDYEHGQESYDGVYKKKDGKMWFKIKSVEKLKNGGDIGYCFEVLNDEAPYFMLPNGLITHNCRLRLNLSELRHRNGGLFGAGDSTGSIGVVTLNLPRLGYENKGNTAGFYRELDKYLDIARDSLEIKRDWIQQNMIDTNMIPAYMEYVGTINNHFSTIGIVGMNEMCENFMGKNILDDEANRFCIEVGEHIRQKLLEYQDQTGHLYNYEATPAESTCYRFALGDKKIYPDIITQGSGKDCYYTNSCHIPVKLIEGIDDTFKRQEALQKQFTGGTVIHIWENGAISGEQAKAIVKSMCENYRVPYMSLSPISRYCDEHGYIADKVDKCPYCKQRLKKYQRITGYLRCVDNFNRGKKAEFADRVQL